jgi:hypothetical protein
MAATQRKVSCRPSKLTEAIISMTKAMAEGDRGAARTICAPGTPAVTVTRWPSYSAQRGDMRAMKVMKAVKNSPCCSQSSPSSTARTKITSQ